MNVNMNFWSRTVSIGWIRYFFSILFDILLIFTVEYAQNRANSPLALIINREMCGNKVKTELPAYQRVLTLLKDSKMANVFFF